MLGAGSGNSRIAITLARGWAGEKPELSEIEVYKTFTLNSNSAGINTIQYRSGSTKPNSNGIHTVSGSYWDSFLVNFYLSGSNESKRQKKYNDIVHTFALKNPCGLVLAYSGKSTKPRNYPKGMEPLHVLKCFWKPP